MSTYKLIVWRESKTECMHSIYGERFEKSCIETRENEWGLQGVVDYFNALTISNYDTYTFKTADALCNSFRSLVGIFQDPDSFAGIYRIDIEMSLCGGCNIIKRLYADDLRSLNV